MSDAALVCPATGRIVPDDAADCGRCAAVLGEKGTPTALYWCAATRTPAAGKTPTPADAISTQDGDRRSEPVERPRRSAQTRFPGYAVEHVLGEGGGGVVYRVHSRALGRSVALKVLRAGGLASPGQIARFLREIAITRDIDDPGVVRVHDSGVTPDGTPWYAMELVDGLSLAGVLAGPLRPPLAELVRVVEDVARTLERLHARGIYHRDVKPGNVLLTQRGEALLSDFGVALEVDCERLSRSTQAVGTPRFMPAEQLACTVRDWARVDVYALGVVLGDCLAAAADAPPSILRWIVARATAREPAQRHATALELARDLAAWRRPGRRVWPSAIGRWRLGRVLRRPGVKAAVLAATVAAVGVGGGLAWLQGTRRIWDAAAAWKRTSLQVDEAFTAGRDGEALALLERFAARPEMHGTPTEPAALLALAERRVARQEISLGLDAALRALSAATDPRARDEPLRLAATLAAQSEQWDLLARLVALGETPGWADGAVQPTARAALALAFTDLASDTLPEGDRALLAPLARGTPTDLRGALHRDLRGNGVLRPVVGVVGLAAAERLGAGWAVPASWNTWAGEPEGLGALAQNESGDLLALGPAGISVLGRGLSRRVSDAVAIDGRVFVGLEGFGDSLAEVRAGVLASLDAGTDHLDFHVLGLAAGDVDGDGNADLVASLGPPDGMTIRAWRLTPEGVQRLGDGRVGYVRLAGVLPAGPGFGPRVVAMREDRHPAWPLFGHLEPNGGLCATLVLGLKGSTLEALQTQPFHAPGGACPPAPQGGLVDLDLDGRPEVVVTYTDDAWPSLEHTWIYRQGADGLLAPPLHVAGARVLALEAGKGRSPPRFLLRIGPNTQAARIVETRGVDAPTLARDRPALAAPLDDAECGGLLRALGLWREAAVACQAEGAAVPAREGVAFGRAAEAWLEADDPERAQDALERLAHLGHARTDVPLLTRTMGALASAAPTRAGLLWSAADEASDRPLGDWLRRVNTPSVSLDLSHALPTTWAQDLPQAVRHDPLAQRLTLRIPAGAGPVLRLPLRALGGPVRLQLEATWTRGEWASHVGISLRPVGGRALEYDLTTKGGNGTYTRFIDGPCGLVEQRAEVADDLPFALDGATGPRPPPDASGQPSPDAPHLACRTTLGSTTFRYAASRQPWAAEGEPWELVIEGGAPLMNAVGQVAVLAIRRLELSGVAPAPPAPPQRAPWTRWALGGPLPTAGPLTGDDVDHLAVLARIDPPLVHRLRPLVGDAAAAQVFARAAATNAIVHMDDLETQETLRSPPPLQALPQMDQSTLAIGQAAGLAASGEGLVAEAALGRAVRLAEAGGHGAWRQGLLALAMVAELALSRDDPAAARAAAQRAVALAPDPDLGRRLLRHRPRFEALVGQPGWEMLNDP